MVEDVFYWYADSEYAGTGYMLVLVSGYKNEEPYKGVLFYDCSHCSCYGPLKHFMEYHDPDNWISKVFSPNFDFNTLNCTEEYKAFVQPLINEAEKKHGQK